MTTVFLRALESADKPAALLAAIHDPEAARGRTRFEVAAAGFGSVPRSPFAYWVSERVRRRFVELSPFEATDRTAKQGLATADDSRFVRACWESPSGQVGAQWLPFAKGGAFSRFYVDIAMLVNWPIGDPSGKEPKAFAELTPGTSHWSRRIASSDFYLRPGLTWPVRGVRFSAQAVPTGCVFGIAGKMAFLPNDRPAAWLTLFNSAPFDQFIAVFAGKVGGVQYEVGLIQSLPVPTLKATDEITLATLAHCAWSLCPSLDTRTETSHSFALPALLQLPAPTLADRAAAWADRVRATDDELAAIQAEIDERCFDLYGLDEPDRRAITEGFGGAGVAAAADGQAAAGGEDDGDAPADTAADAPTLAAELVAPRDRDLRRWLAREYFGLHLRAYSKSRRRAPIYWQLGTASGSYSVWLYYHRFTRDTLFTVLNDYVTPKLRHEERRLTGLVQEIGPQPTPSQRRDIVAQEAFVEELRAFREELARVAPLWDPDLNDGVILNFAPLWRLIPQHKAWQREVKAAWDRLAAGAYDWAHLAMHLWPERVVPKCATDRSLSIAHGLEDAFWVEGEGGKWRPCSVDAATVERLVAERASAAVREAVADLLQAPAASVGGARRGRAGDRGNT